MSAPIFKVGTFEVVPNDDVQPDITYNNLQFRYRDHASFALARHEAAELRDALARWLEAL